MMLPISLRAFDGESGMAKRKLLQWMRERLKAHASEVVTCSTEKKVLDAAYSKAAPLVTAVVQQKFPPADMKVLKKWHSACFCSAVKLSNPDGAVVEFKFENEDGPLRADHYEYRHQVYLASAATAAAVEKWKTASDAYTGERKKRIAAYGAMIDGSSTVEDLIAMWPEAAGVLPSGSPPIALGPEQIAIIKADLRERKAA
jgi:hypothetical protein